MDVRSPFLGPLFNDIKTSDILLRIDNIHFHAHVCVLSVTSRFWNRYFRYTKLQKRFTLLNEKINNDNDNNNCNNDYNKNRNNNSFSHDEREIMFRHDYSCLKSKSITKLYQYKGDPETELNYTFEDFGIFLKYLYGYPIEERDVNKFFVLAYLASNHKFDVPELLEFCDQILYKMWDCQNWRVTLRVSKWIGLIKLRFKVLKYIYSKGDSMFLSYISKELDEFDWKIIYVISDKDPSCKSDFEELFNIKEYEECEDENQKDFEFQEKSNNCDIKLKEEKEIEIKEEEIEGVEETKKEGEEVEETAEKKEDEESEMFEDFMQFDITENVSTIENECMEIKMTIEDYDLQNNDNNNDNDNDDDNNGNNVNNGNNENEENNEMITANSSSSGSFYENFKNLCMNNGNSSDDDHHVHWGQVQY
ncbi:hypothetical protein Glove_138g13 [Diversispora epigaea]|uniref:BTB domain-containing protein n=1 Tax=Diversispora epigaea TaxID=1348612 RepID=A0A397J5A8_9GLOM|nr:hypothetical protein Glove_138g13 [Diversispora epigaea]